MRLKQLALGCALAAAPAGHAQTISLTATNIGTITHSFTGVVSTDTQTLGVTPPTAELVSNNTLIVSYLADAGEAYSITLNSGAGTVYFELNAQFGTPASPYATVTSDTIAFDYFTGSSANVNSNSGSDSIAKSGTGLSLGSMDGVTGNFSFTGFTDTIVYSNAGMAQAALGSFAGASFVLYDHDALRSVDAGQLMTLTPAPEPSTLALGAAGLAGLALARRRAK